MSPTFASVLAAAEALPDAERRELVSLLLEGLGETTEAQTEGQSPGLPEAWRQEVARRSAEYDAGQAETVSWEEVQKRWQARGAAGG